LIVPVERCAASAVALVIAIMTREVPTAAHESQRWNDRQPAADPKKLVSSAVASPADRIRSHRPRPRGSSSARRDSPHHGCCCEQQRESEQDSPRVCVCGAGLCRVR